MLETSAIILQIIIAFLSTVTGVIVTYYGFRLNQKIKPKDNTKLEIIRAAVNEIEKFSKKIKPIKEDKDIIDFIIYELPTKVNEIEYEVSILNSKESKIFPKLKSILIINICILLLEIIFLFYPNVVLISTSTFFSISTLILVLTSVITFRTISHYISDAKRLLKKYQFFTEDLEEIKQLNTTNLFTRNELIKLIDHRNKLGFGTSISNIKNELELYGIQVAESEIIRSHLDILHPNSEDRQEILDLYYMDGKLHTEFDELSEKEILDFIEIVKENIEKLKTQENSEIS